MPHARFTFSPRVLVKTFGEMRMRQGTYECRHSHSCAKTTRHSWNILVSFDLGLIYRHVSESFETRREQVESVEDETNVPFTLSFSSCLILSRQECKPGIIQEPWFDKEQERSINSIDSQLVYIWDGLQPGAAIFSTVPIVLGKS